MPKEVKRAMSRRGFVAGVRRPFPAPAVHAEDSHDVRSASRHQCQGIEGSFAYRRRPGTIGECLGMEVALRPW